MNLEHQLSLDFIFWRANSLAVLDDFPPVLIVDKVSIVGTFFLDYLSSLCVTLGRNQSVFDFEIAFGQAAQALMKTQVVPEGDAYCFSKLAGTEGISEAEEKLTDGIAVLNALVTAKNKMDEDEVPEENRILFITPSKLNMIEAVDSYKSKECLKGFKEEVRRALQEVVNELNQGQRQKLAKKENIRELFELYGIVID